ncbi:hypothetical protein UVI_02009690 [Ustilaginoidea virens]|uniref:Riboflavin kinase n=1 Tax=Ustilaginoidea virens TaxID=1159556 RepID=A0A1B5KUC9_USTVR|nr:hypothetical protein UVI_02009690 [Ustilaginoidea virens]
MAPDGRPSIVGPPDGPEPPFPYVMQGKVISGFGRGSKEVRPPRGFCPHPQRQGLSGGPASSASSSSPPFAVFPMVMSIGYNPFYKNAVRSAEVHVLHSFAADFYGAHMRLLILGYIRQEKDYESLEALIEDIRFDCEVARNSLDRGGWTPEAVRVEGYGHGADWLLREA